MKKNEKKSLLMTIIVLVIALNSVAQITGTFTDSRDSTAYRTVTIGTQTWMAENLAYKASSGCGAYNDDVIKLTKYGYLYSWQTAKTVCPTGWHLPSDVEWATLTNYLGGDSVAGRKLKSTTGWNGEGATNESGFTALPGGYRSNDGIFDDAGYGGGWWSSTEEATDGAWYRYIYYYSSKADRYSTGKSNAFSVRCVRDN